MANYIDANGIHIETLNDIITGLETGFKSIYGQDINVESSSPDGQLINIIGQSKIDLLNLAVSIYDSMNPDTVVGQAQDALYKLVGVYRTQARYSYVNVNITVDRAVSLQGLDDNILVEDATGFTVADTVGNNYILANSIALTAAGTYLLEFRSQNAGSVTVLPNTITNLVTVLLGVVSCNNPSAQYLTGNVRESDADFRVRFNKSRGINGQGFNDALTAQLLVVSGVEQAIVFENRTDIVDADGIPPHSIWAIVNGGQNADVGMVIYNNLTDGAGMKGNTTVAIQKANGMYEDIVFQRPTSQNLYIRANLKKMIVGSLDLATIKTDLINRLSFDIYGAADSASITCALNTIGDGTFIPYDVEVSTDGVSYSEYVLPSTKSAYFALTAGNIDLTVV